jgi:hypothetical protein
MALIEIASFRKYLLTVLVAAAVLYGVATLRWAAILLFIPGGVVVIWAVITLILIAARRVGRKARAVNLLIWLVTVIASNAIISYRQAADQENAARVVAAVTGYKTRAGIYPKQLADAGADVPSTAESAGIRYELYDGQAKLRYSDAWQFKTFHEYDSAKNSWAKVYVD